MKIYFINLRPAFRSHSFEISQRCECATADKKETRQLNAVIQLALSIESSSTDVAFTD